MKNIKIILAMLLALSSTSMAGDLGYRYKNGKCTNSQGQVGLNPYYWGQCADFRGVTIAKFSFDGIDFSGADFTGANLEKSTFVGTILTSTNFETATLSGIDFGSAQISGSNFRKAILKQTTFGAVSNSDFTDVDFSGSILTYLSAPNSKFVRAKIAGIKVDNSDFSGADLTGADFSNSDLTASNLAGAQIAGANFSGIKSTKTDFSGAVGLAANFQGAVLTQTNWTNAAVSKANFRSARLTGAQLKGGNFEGSDIRGADLTSAKYDQVKFKGATYSKKTLLPFDSQYAQTLGLLMQKSATILIMWDTLTEDVKTFAKALGADGTEVILSDKAFYMYDGTTALSKYDAIIQMNGDTYAQDIPMAGQAALVSFVKAGGTFVYGEWNSFSFGNDRLQGLRDLIILDGGNTFVSDLSIKAAPGQEGHSLLEGLPSAGFTISNPGHSETKLHTFNVFPAVSVMKGSNGSDAVALRPLEKGLVVGFSFVCTYQNGKCLNQADVVKLYLNAANSGL